MFTKKDLRNGDVCIQRNGSIMIYIDCLGGIFVHDDGYDVTSDFDDNLCDKRGFCPVDIMKVYRPSEPYQCQFDEELYTNGKLVFDRKHDQKPILDKE